ncbi:hypothetical protein [Natronomonas salsuginis]|uniref:Zinc ribbon domain-containing protein n=1 Tax=Natronomonas salsuginis TaxID=2217661 RepID=A0A4U5J9S5_9EURY|nr:hypothetical protein [Natronomonas salsuginis]TKR25890.1 hypothetical protein DM868_05165 [Natronomonas salsuginis]
MGEITVEVDGIEHTYAIEEWLVCDSCSHGWLKLLNENSEACPECGAKEVSLTAEQITDRPKWLWDRANSIEEMAARTEHKAKLLRKLAQRGWALNEPPRDGYARLTKSTEQDENSDEIEVTLSEQ